ncbi:MAG: hypothetical protein E6G94_06275 [Alphaproteobacteria bacterium]|nr:MAG: hypothetical protein E6G94_06275 [Alphaproteobacteria bacterium]
MAGKGNAKGGGGDGLYGRPNKHREMQMAVPPRRKLFGAKLRKVFLEWFAATGNCVFSAQQAGIGYQTVWKHRMKDPAFAEAFDLASEQGVARAVARQREDKIREGAITIDGDLDPGMIEPADPKTVLLLVREYERARHGRRKVGRRPTVATNEEVDKWLATRLAAYSRRVRAQFAADRALGPARCPCCGTEVEQDSASSASDGGAESGAEGAL